MSTGSSILDRILAVKRTEVADAVARRPRERVEAAAAAMPPSRGMMAALRRGPGEPLRAIAEIKRASPSAGPIRPDADAADIARRYTDAGASGISVLTDESFFGGSLAFLAAAREAVATPLLRKDFILDAYQVAEARAAGADAVLLIVAALDDAALRALIAEVRGWNMDPLVEVHDEAEAARAVAAGAALIGVNHRNLADFSMDMELTARLRGAVPPEAVLVAESGIKTAADVRRMAEAGADAVLVGESLMRAPDPGAALRELLA